MLCCFALFVCLTLLASFFLPSHLSFKNTYIYIHTYIHTPWQLEGGAGGEGGDTFEEGQMEGAEFDQHWDDGEDDWDDNPQDEGGGQSILDKH